MTMTVVFEEGDTIYYEKTLIKNIDLFRNQYNFGYLSIIRVPRVHKLIYNVKIMSNTLLCKEYLNREFRS